MGRGAGAEGGPFKDGRVSPEGLLVLAAVVSASGGGMAHAKEKRGCEEGADGGCREGEQRR